MENQTKERDLVFIKEHWVRLAALAWKGYQQRGPGAVVIFANEDTSLAELELSKVTLSFLDVKHAKDLRPSLRELVKKCQPQQQIVVDVIQKSSRRTYRLGMKPAPPDAFERIKSVL